MLWIVIILLLASHGYTFYKGREVGIHIEYQRRYEFFNGKPVRKDSK
ncbi:hypothetical protein SEA_MINIFLAYER_22 [Satellite phage MiniFlayer]|nr:hypothetical protein SEA_MINIFLAYER_22 [Satellite phage MiniFlayer]